MPENNEKYKEDKNKVVMPKSDGSVTDFSSDAFTNSLNEFLRIKNRMESIGGAREMSEKAREGGNQEDYPTTTGLKGSMRPLGSSFEMGGKMDDKDLGNMKVTMSMGGRTFKTE